MAEPVQLHQRHEDVKIHLDGDAHAWVWTPNITDPDKCVQINLLPDLAVYCHLGRGRPREQPTWDDRDLTLIVAVDLGAGGSAAIAGQPISESAVAALAAAGFIRAIRVGMEQEQHQRNVRERNKPEG